MPTEIVRQQTPEEVELLRKREELAGVRAELAERELELADIRAQLKSFEGRYLRQVGVLYAELDEWGARIAELEAKLNPSLSTEQQAKTARQRADETHEATQGEASKAQDFRSSSELRSLFREVAKRVHPDFAKDEADCQHRTRLMAQANVAYSNGDADALKRIIEDYDESVQAEDIGAELIRIIRQIHQARKNIKAIEAELDQLSRVELSQLRSDAQAAEKEGIDLLAQLATELEGKIEQRRKEHVALAEEVRTHGR
jgi:DNA repair exonuclease SbcCD ATPase subunit